MFVVAHQQNTFFCWVYAKPIYRVH